MDRLTHPEALQNGRSLSKPARERWAGACEWAEARGSKVAGTAANGLWPSVEPAGAAVARAAAEPQPLAWLSQVIETEVIPRLMLAHRTPHAAVVAKGESAAKPSADDVDRFTRIVLGDDAAAADQYVQAMRSEGVSFELILLELLAPVARRLGALWEADLCDFTAVTVALWRIQRLVHELSPSFQNDSMAALSGRRAMLVPAPGSQHTLGLLMVSEFFRRAGWEVWGDPRASVDDITDAAHGEWFDLAGFSLGSECHVETLASVILDLRRASLNRAIGVMVGGPIVLQHPELVAQVGADGTAEDAPAAVRFADEFLAERERRC